MKGKYIYVDVISKTLNEKGRKKLEDFQNVNEFELPVDSQGKSREWYEDMGISPPKELIDRENEIQKGLHLDESDCDEDLEESFVSIDSIEFATNNYDGGCTIFTKGGSFLKVADDVDDVLSQIYFAQMSMWGVFKEWIKNKFRKQQ